MRLTVYTDYALRVLMYLAVKQDGLATIDDMCAAMERLLPGYRRQHLPSNIAALRAGADQVTADSIPLLAAPPRQAPAASGTAGGAR